MKTHNNEDVQQHIKVAPLLIKTIIKQKGEKGTKKTHIATPYPSTINLLGWNI